ncbi:MAG: hypothetical protein IJM63_05710 [Solobacterium sp.]|nr:hypothetical protein [Solobacterium sp.]
MNLIIEDPERVFEIFSDYVTAEMEKQVRREMLERDVRICFGLATAANLYSSDKDICVLISHHYGIPEDDVWDAFFYPEIDGYSCGKTERALHASTDMRRLETKARKRAEQAAEDAGKAIQEAELLIQESDASEKDQQIQSAAETAIRKACTLITEFRAAVYFYRYAAKKAVQAEYNFLHSLRNIMRSEEEIMKRLSEYSSVSLSVIKDMLPQTGTADSSAAGQEPDMREEIFARAEERAAAAETALRQQISAQHIENCFWVLLRLDSDYSGEEIIQLISAGYRKPPEETKRIILS